MYHDSLSSKQRNSLGLYQLINTTDCMALDDLSCVQQLTSTQHDTSKSIEISSSSVDA